MSSTKKPYRFNNKDVVVKAENALYNGDIANVENAEDAIDNLNGRVATLELGGGGSSVTPSSSPFVGKKIALLGDSFSASGGWLQVMCQDLGVTSYHNEAVSGGTWRRIPKISQGKGSFMQAVAMKSYYDSQGTSPDYIIICLGTNDATNITGAGWLLGDIDFGVVHTKTENGQTVFDYYERKTTISNDSLRWSRIDPANYVYAGEFDTSIEDYNQPSSPLTDCLDTRYITGGMQATIQYLRFHYPNANIRIGFTPSGLVHSWPYRTNINAVVDRMKELADLYGVVYINTFQSGLSPFVDACAGLWGGGHPSPNSVVQNPVDGVYGKDVIGHFMAHVMLSNP